jgi:hypothetical protein
MTSSWVNRSSGFSSTWVGRQAHEPSGRDDKIVEVATIWTDKGVTTDKYWILDISTALSSRASYLPAAS